jgi:hypothetical protein
MARASAAPNRVHAEDLRDLRVGEQDPPGRRLRQHHARRELGEGLLEQRALGAQRRLRLAPLARELQVRAHARDQLAAGERLRQVVVHARAEPLDRRLLARPRGEHDHGELARGRVLAQGRDEPVAVEARHHRVRDQQVGRLRAHRLQGGHAVGHHVHVPERRQQPRQVAAQVGVVVGDQDARGDGSRPALPGGVGRPEHALGFGVRRQPADRLLHEQRRARRVAPAVGVAQLLGRQVGRPEREPDREARALADHAGHGDRAPVQLRELLDQREPDARALVAASARALDAVEALEEPVELVGRDAAARVGHHQLGMAVDGLQAHVDAARERELERVGEQVEDDPLPHVAVDVDGLGERIARHAQLDPAAPRGVAEAARQLPGQRGEVDGLEGGARATLLDARELQQRVDELQQPLTVAVHERHLARAEPAPAVLERVLERAEHQRQRRAELVADVGKERRLRPVQFGELLGSALLGLVAARAADRRGDVAGDKMREGAVIVIQYPVAVQGGHQKPVGRTTLRQQWDD